MKIYFLKTFFILLSITACTPNKTVKEKTTKDGEQEGIVTTIDKIPVILDTDANNELDDQHAMAYMFFNDSIFDIIGLTVNTTTDGGNIEQQYAEAERVMKMCAVKGKYPLIKGADGNFEDIRPNLEKEEYDGKDAVEFIISEAKKTREQKLVLLPVGKLTNVALALVKAPEIAKNIKIIWLGTNYPQEGEYNMLADVPSMNYVLGQDVEFELVTVRYTNNTGSNGVGVSAQWVYDNMPGTGPAVTPVEGRHGGEFTHFGDYAVDLFKNIKLYGDPPSRALFDVVAVAILKNSTWGKPKKIPCPAFIGGEWKEQPDNPRKILIWEYFDRDSIVDDFLESMKRNTTS